MKVHRLVIMVVDHDDLGAEGVRRELEAARFANNCISPIVMAQDTVDIFWSDRNPVNITAERFGAFCELFSRRPGDP